MLNFYAAGFALLLQFIEGVVSMIIMNEEQALGLLLVYAHRELADACPGQCIMRERRTAESRRWWAPPPLRHVVQGLRCVTAAPASRVRGERTAL
jgi:hypothetical protein